MITRTQDASARDGWSAWAWGPRREERVPRLRLLYHADLGRIGSLSHPGAVGPTARTLGRYDPPFGGLGGAVHPIDDPQVSREQLRIRWDAAAGVFEVEPAPAARRPLGRVDLDGTTSTIITPITGLARLPPGSVVAIGDRVLLGLELGRVHPPDADRMGLVGESEALWALREAIEKVTQFGRAALVNGPTGAGKELVARALHDQGPRAKGPFIPVNCAALPETLVESTLFGHRKGAFTGADAEGKGLFRAADGGTLFLDELGELPLSVQPKLLRALQESVIVPVGTTEGRRVDVRVVAATHRDLEAQVREGRLREDLYHRLAAHVVNVPPLAERRLDIPELFVHLLSRLCADHPSLGWLWEGGESFRPAIPIGYIADLMRRPFPGNVRELSNLVERTARENLHPGPFRAPDLPTLDPPPPSADIPSAREHIHAPSMDISPPSADIPAPSTDIPAAPDALIREAGEALGLAHKTVLKLLPGEALIACAAESAGLAPEQRASRLRARAAEALLALLEERVFNQSAVAAALGTSRTTLIKLMDDLGLPRATDLDPDAIHRAREAAGGDLEKAAKILRVSPNALKKRLTLMALKGKG